MARLYAKEGSKTWDPGSEGPERKLPRDEEKENYFKQYGAIESSFVSLKGNGPS